MKILLLTPQLPYPPHQGTSLRNLYIIKGLALNYEITLLTFGDKDRMSDGMNVLEELCEFVYVVPEPKRTIGQRILRMIFDQGPDVAHRLQSQVFDETLTDLLKNKPFDVIQIEGIELARAIFQIRGMNSDSLLVFDDHNAETELQRRALLTDLKNPGRWAAALYSLVQVGRLRKFEAEVCNTADAVTVVSENDAAKIKELGVSSPITVVPNCLDVLEFQAKLNQLVNFPKYDLVFTGKMDYRPNVDAVLWFVNEIYPLILKKRPQTTFVIVGQKPHRRLNSLKDIEGITITGQVPEIRPFLAGAKVFVMPFRVGSGTRLKLIEAMAAGKAIVSTPVGAEGFQVADSEELLFAEDATDFAEKVLKLLQEDEARYELGEKAADFARRYDWRQIISLLEEVYVKTPQKIFK